MEKLFTVLKAVAVKMIYEINLSSEIKGVSDKIKIYLNQSWF